MAFRVPTANVSVVDLTARLSKGVSYFFSNKLN
jgi:glyceraldehyde-3-phosphate dehydrogenase/erythrose-4-phosphate dehydrogenase